MKMWNEMKNNKKYIPKGSAMILLLTFLLSSLLGNTSYSQEAVKKSDSIVPVTTTIKNTLFNDVRENMINMVRNGEAPSFSVAVSKNGKIIWEESFGWADRE